MVIIPLADIAGANSAVQLTSSAAGTFARTVIFTITTGSGSPRVGDSTAAAAKGTAIPASGALVLPISVDPNDRYCLNSMYVYVPTGTTVSVSYGV